MRRGGVCQAPSATVESPKAGKVNAGLPAVQPRASRAPRPSQPVDLHHALGRDRSLQSPVPISYCSGTPMVRNGNWRLPMIQPDSPRPHLPQGAGPWQRAGADGQSWVGNGEGGRGARRMGCAGPGSPPARIADASVAVNRRRESPGPCRAGLPPRRRDARGPTRGGAGAVTPPLHPECAPAIGGRPQTAAGVSSPRRPRAARGRH
jgi:hypothetical protein